MLAVVHAIQSLPEEIQNTRVDASVDSQVVIGAWQGQGGKTSLQLVRATKDLFFAVSSRNIQLHLQYVESSQNKADDPSRWLSRLDTKLSTEAFARVENALGGSTGHSFDLMALDSNAVVGRTVPSCPILLLSQVRAQGESTFSVKIWTLRQICLTRMFFPRLV